MKKMWKDEEAITLDRVIFITIIVILVVLIGFYSYFHTEEETEPRDDRTWEISVEGDYYLIEFHNIRSWYLDEISWAMLNLNRLVETWDDPDAETIRMEGDLIDVNYSVDDHEDASLSVNETFYSLEPDGDPPVSCNHTLCVVFYDDDTDGKLSKGDYFKVRPIVNGGCAMGGYRFRLVSENMGITYGERFFPPFPED